MSSDSRALTNILVIFAAILVIGAAVFGSTTLAFASILGIVFLFLAIKKPLWAIGFLAVYFPLEPFLMKFIPEQLFLFVRYAPELLLYGVVFLAVLYRLKKGSLSTPLNIPFALFMIVLVTSVAINFVPATTAVIGIRQIIRFVLVFFAVVYLRPSKTYIRNITLIMLGMVLFQSALGLTQVVVGESLDAFLFPAEGRFLGDITLAPNAFRFWDPGSRVFGTMGRYDRLGTFLGMFLLIAAGLLYEVKHHWKLRRELWIVFLLGLPALVFTYSRSGWFGFVLGFLLIALYLKKDHMVKFAVGAFLIIIVSYAAVTGVVVNRLVDVPQQGVTERFFEAFSFSRWQGEYYGLGRLFWIVNTPLHVVPSAPLFGHGPGQFGGGAVSALRNTTVYDNLGLPFGVAATEGYIDNNWLSIWGESGTLGLIFYLWMMVVLFKLSFTLWRRGSDSFSRAIGLGMCGVIVAFSLNAFLASFLEARTLAFYFWMYAGFVVVLSKKEGLLYENN